MKELVLKEFQQIPGVGKVVAQDLWDLGFRSTKELKNKNPEELYIKLCAHEGTRVDRCMLYVFRCAVYFASNKIHDPELLKWWNWKDDKRTL
ncbi:MAG: helix-hairpin-helix domain-containing protein [Actinobacteria bacterium]|nr:helix-hairpin-helix domain-containing protein [Actinomycetota bacterium]